VLINHLTQEIDDAFMYLEKFFWEKHQETLPYDTEENKDN
jgi:hypothetical protein